MWFPEVEERGISHSRSVKLGLCDRSEESPSSKHTLIPARVSWSDSLDPGPNDIQTTADMSLEFPPTLVGLPE